ncbi:unnamed protein product, partial [Didymodactylos carnosus]
IPQSNLAMEEDEKYGVQEETFEMVTSISPSANAVETGMQFLEGEKMKSNVTNACMMYSKEKKRLACIPCGHLAACVSCGQSVRTCPICLREITSAFNND